MLLSRFWYVVMAVALGAVTFALYLSTSMYDRASVRTTGEALAGDSQVVAWFLRDDARKRATALIVPALDEDIRTQLAKSSDNPEKIPNDSKEKVRAALKKQFNAIPAEQKFDAMFAVDQVGRVVGQVGFDQASGIENFEIGGYALVADALHGWIRDDSWVLGGRIYRVVGRPVENDVTKAPAGAIIGARILDDGFARELSRKTGAAIGFYANGARVSSGAPEGFDTAQLDTITSDLKSLDADPTYKEKGVSDVRTIHDNLGVVYARIIGEAWDLGAGYAVARTAHLIGSPLGFLNNADDKDKRSVPLVNILLMAVLFAGMGLAMSFFEHTQPLRVFRTEAERFGKGSSDQLQPSKFRGVYRQIASNINDGVEKVAAKGGAPRRAADLDAVLGPIPAQPAMSAFSLPQEAPSGPASGPGSAPLTPAARAPAVPVPAPKPAASTPGVASPIAVPAAAPDFIDLISPPSPAVAAAPVAPAAKPIRAPAAKPPSPTLLGVAPAAPVPASPSPVAAPSAAVPVAPAPFPKPIPAAGRPANVPAPSLVMAPVPAAVTEQDSGDDEATVVSQVPNEILGQLAKSDGPAQLEDEAVEWRRVYDEFVRLKKECGEPVDGLSFEKFKNTLRKNRDTLLQRHGCKAVKFSVYVKEGKAALKANPVRG